MVPRRNVDLVVAARGLSGRVCQKMPLDSQFFPIPFKGRIGHLAGALVAHEARNR